MPPSAAALKTFAEDYRTLSGLSRESSSYDLGRASGLIRKFIWPKEGADVIRSALGMSGGTTIDLQQFDKPVAAATALRAHLIIPHLAVLPEPIGSYYAIPLQKGVSTQYQAGTVPKTLGLPAYCAAPFVLIDGEWITRQELVSHFAYDAGHVHYQLTLGTLDQQARIRSAGKLQLPNAMLRDDMGFFWVGPGGENGRDLMLLGDRYEIRELLLLQIVKEVVNAPSVTELVVEIELRVLLRTI